ncbi:MAG: hypothetical protein Q8Q65_02330 [bacterium]|nr:hypothetical protein [bacterium]
MINQILRRKCTFQTVFSVSDVARLTGKQPDENLLSALSYHVKKGNLLRLTKGIYSLDNQYSREELANKLRQPSYISLYTVLQKTGVVFQPYTSIFVVSNRSETLVIDNQKYLYRKIKDTILLNSQGISENNGVFEACVERAILDKVYLDGEEHFDNLNSVDWNYANNLNVDVFKSKTIQKYINKHAG